MKTFMLAAVLAAALSAPALAQAPATTFVQAGRVLVDPASGKVETNKTLVVQGGKVVRIADGFVSETWQPVSPLSGRLDAFEWKAPFSQIANSSPPNRATRSVGRTVSRKRRATCRSASPTDHSARATRISPGYQAVASAGSVDI